MINEFLTRKKVAYGQTAEELMEMMMKGFLPYESPENVFSPHRPAGIEIQLTNGERKDTQKMTINELMTFGEYISDRIFKEGPDSLAFGKFAKKTKTPHILNAKITLGDVMQMVNDEYLYRKFFNLTD